MKTCKRCQEAKPVELFVRDKSRPDGLFPYCRPCHSAGQKKWMDADPERKRSLRQRGTAAIRAKREANRESYQQATRDYVLRCRYGLTHADYERLLTFQGGGCAICGTPPETQHHGRLHIDHDHTTGAVRGLLCFQHNVWMDRGLPTDSPELLVLAAKYLIVPPMVRLAALTREAG